MASFQGKAVRLTVDVYRTFQGDDITLNAYQIWRKMGSPGRPGRTTIAKRVSKLHKEGYLRETGTDVKPSGQRVPYYTLTTLFDLAIAELDVTINKVVIPKDLIDSAKEFLKSDRAKAMGLFTVCDVVNAAARELLRDHGVHVAESKVVRDIVEA